MNKRFKPVDLSDITGILTFETATGVKYCHIYKGDRKRVRKYVEMLIENLAQDPYYVNHNYVENNPAKEKYVSVIDLDDDAEQVETRVCY